MWKKGLAVVLVMVSSGGCITGRMGPLPFTGHWANQRLQERQYAARLERIGKPLLKGMDPERTRTPAVAGHGEGVGAAGGDSGTSGTIYGFSW